jgi:hypothetical protein
MKNNFYIVGLVVLFVPMLVFADANDFFEKANKKEINEKVYTFCSAGSYNEERCEKYCIDLRDWFYWNEKWYDFWNPWELEGGWFHDSNVVYLCDHPNQALDGKDVALSTKPKIQKKIIKNDDGTTTEIIKKTIDDVPADVETTFSSENKKLYEEVKTEIKNDDGTITQKTVKTNFGDEVVFKEEITEETFREGSFVNNVLLQKNDDNIIKTQKFFNESVLKEFIVQQGVDEDNLKDVVHKLYNFGLLENEYLKTHNVQISYDEQSGENVENAYFDVLKHLFVLEQQDSQQNKIITIDEDDSNSIYENNIKMDISLPIEMNINNKQLFLIDDSGAKKQWNIMPSEIYAKSLNEDLDNITGMKLINEDGIKYVIKGTKNKKLLGFYPIDIEQYKVYSIDTGQLLNTKMTQNNIWIDKISF